MPTKTKDVLIALQNYIMAIEENKPAFTISAAYDVLRDLAIAKSHELKPTKYNESRTFDFKIELPLVEPITKNFS